MLPKTEGGGAETDWDWKRCSCVAITERSCTNLHSLAFYIFIHSQYSNPKHPLRSILSFRLTGNARRLLRAHELERDSPSRHRILDGPVPEADISIPILGQSARSTELCNTPNNLDTIQIDASR